MYHVLPRGSGSNGVINVERKRKLSRKFPVISQQVRCEKIQAALNYLVTHNHLYENINTVLAVVSPEEINNENDFPIDFNIKMSLDLNKKHESAEKKVDSDFFSNSNKEVKFVDEEFANLIKPFEQKGIWLNSLNPLNSFQTPTGETLQAWEILNVLIDDENTISALGQGKVPYSLSNNQYCEEFERSHFSHQKNLVIKWSDRSNWPQQSISTSDSWIIPKNFLLLLITFFTTSAFVAT